MTYRLSVFVPVVDRHVVHVFLVRVDRSLSWVRQHADELAAECLPNTRYNALMVEEG